LPMATIRNIAVAATPWPIAPRSASNHPKYQFQSLSYLKNPILTLTASESRQTNTFIQAGARNEGTSIAALTKRYRSALDANSGYKCRC
jgi:hypothetical protein